MGPSGDTQAWIADLLDDAVRLDLAAFCSACDASADELLALVAEGVLQPQGDEPRAWHFAAAELPRTRRALRLQRALELDAAGVAVALELLERIDRLEARLRRLGSG